MNNRRSRIGGNSAAVDTSILRRVVGVVVADGGAVRGVESRFVALFVGGRHRRRRVEVLRRLRQWRKRLQLGTRPVPIRSLHRVQPMVRRPVQFRRRRGPTHGLAARRRCATRLDRPNVQEARRRNSRVVGEPVRATSAAVIDEFLRLGRMFDAVAVDKEGEAGKHAESDDSDGGSNGDSLSTFSRLRSLRVLNGGAV